MVSLREINRKTGVGMGTLRKLKSAGFLVKTEDENAMALSITKAIARGNPLSVVQLVALIEDPSIEYELFGYAARAKNAVDALGDVKSMGAGREITAYINAAADRDQEALEIIAEWVRSIVPARGEVSHAWVATRLVINSPLQADHLNRISLVMLNVRQAPSLKGWWRVANIGGRTQTFYMRPKNPLANLDL